ncbi:MAG: hypothetical protein UY23_C0006G0053 [Candidatus Jorgensenbacteria bacterium GW2011_GWA1_48_11]|uniref:Toxin-antitoxin system, toxin component, RelE family n=1 Tax=Candidatus Jorgensenbacteria bacterium GW2011_GWA1_48_11 TaxID=1618660 RepID=A0A0G1U9S3_9BACT|nr:MAG: hypothetical protein UY23_C0006G0053 [Candidatus Jorgensenbacteria bacterium GW2011_GWA1_48_11]KKW12375.1 MAG: hypothetical protein UY51_C0005G0617 [Candidatus Jorgensenbacteria bacterium GW2011_GWB1_49_9]
MEFVFWENTAKKCPILKEIGKDADLRGKVLKKLEAYKQYKFEDLKKMGLIEKIKIKNKNKLHELRLGIGKKECRFLFTYKNEKIHLVMFLIKKSNEIKIREIEVADGRAGIIL